MDTKTAAVCCLKRSVIFLNSSFHIPAFHALTFGFKMRMFITKQQTITCTKFSIVVFLGLNYIPIFQIKTTDSEAGCASFFR
jgi:hypothetical protein